MSEDGTALFMMDMTRRSPSLVTTSGRERCSDMVVEEAERTS